MMQSCLVMSVFLVFVFKWGVSSGAAKSVLLVFGPLGNDLSGVSFYVDAVGVLFGGGVSFVVFLVFSYSRGYMGGNPQKKYFFIPLSLFSGSMLLLIFSGDVTTTFLAWDGLGVSSFLLVVFYPKGSSAGAGLVTVVTNRVGDICFLLGLGLLGFEFLPCSNGVVCLLFLVASFSKSAQWPLSAWLPAAMAAPTPVSALVHSSTLVTAGVFLALRFDACFGGSFSGLVPFFELTFVLSCISACCSYDIKHIIAMSTLGNLSLMLACLSVGYSNGALFHLISHALFKALTFLSASNMILACGHSQDLRLMSGVGQKNPISTICFLFASYSLSGFFFTSGFFSKDFMLEAFFLDSCLSVGVLGSCVVGLCAGGYAADLFDAISADESDFPEEESSELGSCLLWPLVVLGVASLVSGWFLSSELLSSSCVMSTSSDFFFFLGLLMGQGSDSAEQFDWEESMSYLVEGVPLGKVYFWGSVLNYCKDMEHGSFEWFGGPGWGLEKSQKFSLYVKHLCEW